MPVTIAVTGKGGTGKTTFCGMLVRCLAERAELCADKPGHILAVDADPNSNLNEVLGIEIPVSLGEIRERMLDKGSGGALPGGSKPTAGMTKQEYMNYMFTEALAEEDGYDMLVMGRTQGAGCYCYVNGILKTQLEKYSGSYSHIIVDNEAGLEHISRGTLPRVDILLILSDCSRRGIQAAGRIQQLSRELNLKPKVTGLIVNRVPAEGIGRGVSEEIENQKLELLGIIPDDMNIYRCDSEGLPSSQISVDSPFSSAVRKIIKELKIKN